MENSLEKNGFLIEIEVDDEPFIKVFPSGMAAMKKLSGTGRRVLDVLCMELLLGKSMLRRRDQVAFNSEIAGMRKPDLSESVFNRGRKELLSAQFLSCSTLVDVYQVNKKFIAVGRGG